LSPDVVLYCWMSGSRHFEGSQCSTLEDEGTLIIIIIIFI